MKLVEAKRAYRAQRQALIDQRKDLLSRRKSLEQKQNIAAEGKECFAEEAATLELSIRLNKEQFEENQKILDNLVEREAAICNAESGRQQADAMKEYAIDMAKIMEVARRIAQGGAVPPQDEQKLMDYSMELYLSAKNMAMLAKMREKGEKYDSLWEDEEEAPNQCDPREMAENSEIDIALPEGIASAKAEAAPEA